jgi:AcrR family transcriptional regulator
MNAPASLRTRKKAKLREALTSAAYRLFLKKGYAATTLGDVSRECGVTVQTLLRYFGSKEDLLFHRQADILAAFKQQLAAAVATKSSIRFFVGFIHENSVRLDHSDETRNIYRIIQAAPALLSKFHAIIRQYEEALEAALSAEAGAKPGEDLHATLMAHLLTAGLIAESLRSIDRAPAPMLAARNAAVADYIVRNFRRPPRKRSRGNANNRVVKRTNRV